MMSLEKLYFDLRLLRPGSVNAYLAAIAIVAAATILRLELARWFAGAQFITFFPAVIITTFVCGIRAGFFAVLLSALSAWVSIFEREPKEEAASAVGFFVAVAIADVVFIGALRGAVARVRELNATLAEAKQMAETASQGKSACRQI